MAKAARVARVKVARVKVARVKDKARVRDKARVGMVPREQTAAWRLSSCGGKRARVRYSVPLVGPCSIRRIR